jgi:hypothetical protein
MTASVSLIEILPSIPATHRWERSNKRTWQFLSLQVKTWYGWKTVSRRALDPRGLGMHYALRTAAEEILEAL